MANWIQVFNEVATLNGNIANGATEVIRPTATGRLRINRFGSYNSIIIQELAGVAGVSIIFDDGQANAKTVLLPSGSTIVVEPDEGEYYTEITISNASGAQYNANSCRITRAIKQLR
jgi:hypothetical protein